MDSVDRLLSQWRSERPDLDVSALGIAIRIDVLAKLLRGNMARSLASVGLKPWQYDVLSVLRRQGRPYSLAASELARESLGAMTTRIDNLEAAGLVTRETDPDDGRGVRVALTRRGVSVVNRAIEARLAAAELAVEAMSRPRRRRAESVLKELLEAAEDRSRRRGGAAA